MLYYEALLLTTPEVTSDESKNLETQLDKLIQAQNRLFLKSIYYTTHRPPSSLIASVS